MSSLINSDENNNNNNEEEIILNLMNDIFQYEKKIQEINNLLLNNNSDINKDQSKLTELKKQKLILNHKISEVDQNISQNIKNKDMQLKLKESMKNEIDNKIQEYKYEINTLNSLSFNPIITKKIFPNNKTKNEILTNEEINNILIEAQNINDNPENEEKIIIDEILNLNQNQEKDLIENINNLKSKSHQIDEQLKMLKEEKLTTNIELINFISCKESIDALIKFNHYLIKNYIKESKNKNMNKIDESKTNDENNIYNRNKWTEPINLFLYELCTLDSEEFSVGFNDIIIDLYDINNKSFNDNNKNNLEIPTIKRKSNSYRKDNNTKNIINTNIFSVSKTLKKEFEFFVKKNKNNDISGSKNLLNDFLEKISNIIISKLKLFLSKKYCDLNFSEINKNIMIYLSYYIKSLYYDKIINCSLKFINKEYKCNKKELQNINNDLNIEIKKLELKQKDINQQINYNEREIKKIQNETKKKKLIDDLKNINKINLSKNEQEYLQLCSKINNLILQKDEINSICEKINDEFKSKNEEIESEKNSLNKQILDINNEIKNIEDNLEQKKSKANGEIVEYRKIIEDKYNKIKTQLKKYKKKYGDDIYQYNYLVNNLNKTIKLRNRDNLNIKDLNYIKLTANSEIIPKNENIYKYSIDYSYEDEKNDNNYKKKNKYLNKTADKIYNMEFSSTKSFYNNYEYNNSKTQNNYNNKLKLSKEKRNSNIYSSNKLQKHANYYEKYFITNSNFDNDEHINNKEKEEKKYDIKSSTQSNYYRCISSNNASINNGIIQNSNYTNYFNSRMSFHENSATRIANLLGKYDKYSNVIPFSEVDPYLNNNNQNMNTYRIVQRQFNINENLYYKFSKSNTINNNNNKENELSKTINELKNNILKKEKLSYKYNIFDKIKILTKITFCYFRNINKNTTKYIPMNKISNENLCKSPYYFMKSSISLNNTYKYIRIGLTTQLDPIDINIKDIQYTVVSSSMKKIIEIYRSYKNFCKENNNAIDKDIFIKKEIEKNSNLSYEYIKKCINNKKYNFVLFSETNQQMEFIFCSYEDFKMWINGLSYIIKNKKKLLELIE